MEMKKLEKKARTLWLIRQACIYLIFVIGALIACFALEDKARTLAIIISASVLVILAAIMFTFPFLSYRFYSYGMDDKRIIIKKGVIFKHHIVIPVIQIQDMHIYAGPIMALTHLSGVIISTAGSNFVINGLSDEVAKNLVSTLEERLEERKEQEANEEVHE